MTGSPHPTEAPRPTEPPRSPEPPPTAPSATPEHPHDATSLSPTPRQLWTRSRGIALALVILLAAAVAIAVVRSGGQHGRLDPRSTEPHGSRAVAELLDQRGVSTRVVTTTEEARSAAGPGTTLLVANPDLLTERQRSRLHAATKNSAGRTVLIAPGTRSIGTLAPGVTADTPSTDSALPPGCSLPAARRAGTADMGGIRYDTLAPDAEACYLSDGLPSLLHLPAPRGQGDTVVLGAPDILYNSRFDEQGNASLALQLLGSRPTLVWYLPSLSDDQAATEAERRSFFDLIPAGWRWATLQLAIAAVLTALWRARRLGPLVSERLPVVIRASETVEGRARLYRRANARDRAADALRTATRSRLAPLVDVPPTQAHAPETLIPALSSHLRSPGQDLHLLLFGAPPGNDAALIALADQLDALESEVRHS